jgi:hypothetical protein
MVVAEGDSLVPRVIVHDLREVSDCTPDRQDPKGYYYNKACQADLEINRALVANVRKDVSEGRKVIITVLYLNHVTQLVKFFKALGMTVGVFIGQGSRPPALKGCERDRAKVVKLAGEGAFDVVAGYFFGFIMDWGIIGIWMAFPFGLTTAGILYYLRFNRDTK